MSVNCSSINEELGQIKYIFSDKTGTLTCNVMEFSKFSSIKEAYSIGPTSRVKAVLKNKYDQDHDGCSAALLHLAVCHSIIIDKRTNQFNSSSPDELALVQGAKDFGFEFVNRDASKIITIKANGVVLKFELLCVLEFTSQRKRMSVIVRDL